MISVEVFASSSSGNCYRITSGKHSLLLEAGLPIAKIREVTGYSLGRLDGCLITHEHSDHAKGVSRLIKAGVDVYMSEGTAQAAGVKMAHVVKAGIPFQVRGYWGITPLKAYHDAAEPLVYYIADADDTLLFATDTCILPYKFRTIGQLMVECNYLPDIVSRRIGAGELNIKTARRIERSHMSIEHLETFLSINTATLKCCRRIYLLHGSIDNGDADIFKTRVEALIGKPVTVCRP